MADRRIALLVNTRSRKGEEEYGHARGLCAARGLALERARGVADPARLADEVRAAVAAGCDAILVGGGDGSQACAAACLAESDTILGVLPLGTANSFARALGLPLDMAGAIDVVAAGNSRIVDLGCIDDHLYVGCASIGLAPQIAGTVPHALKAWAGRPGYLLWAAAQMLRFRPFRLTVACDGRSETVKVVEVRIANGAYHGGVELVADARLDSGRILVQAVLGRTRIDLVRDWAAHLAGRPRGAGRTRDYEAEAIRIETRPRLPISIDGEVLARTPVTAKAAKAALRVFAP